MQISARGSEVDSVSVEIISASNNNPDYLEFVPVYIDFWLKINKVSRITFIPRIFLIMEEIPPHLEKYKRFLTLVNIDDLDSSFAAQNIRTLATVDSACDFVITSDIDMIPLSGKFFTCLTETAKTNRFSFVVGRDVLSSGQFPICYNIASPLIWEKLIGKNLVQLKLSDRVSKLGNQLNQIGNYDGSKGGSGWYFDQEFVYLQAKKNFENKNVILLNDNETGHRRLDRARHRSFIPIFLIPMIALGYYADYHLPRMNFFMRHFLKLLIKVVK